MIRSFIADISPQSSELVLRGWIHQLRELRATTFIVLKDCSGSVQCVAATDAIKAHHLKLDDAVEIRGTYRSESRAKSGFEIDVADVRVLGRAAADLPFTSSSKNIGDVGADTLLEYRPLAVRHERYNDVFRVQAAILRGFREFLTARRFTEIVTSKIVASGTEGGTNLFELKYFERSAYLAQSPQFYKEHGVAALERVFETGHVYRAEPHATSRHLTEYCSLDLELGFIDNVHDVMQLERELLTFIFEELERNHGHRLPRRLPSMLNVPAWTFEECVERLKRPELVDDLDPQAERDLCALAEKQTGVSAVFVYGFPLNSRPFYTMHSFDLLFNGLEITTGGQRLHTREALESALTSRGMNVASFASHLRMFELGMPPHGGLAVGLERLTAQILGLANVREATLYPRDRTRLTP
jgi:nondiscriminating aspartyl-tRNA synthetase